MIALTNSDSESLSGIYTAAHQVLRKASDRGVEVLSTNGAPTSQPRAEAAEGRREEGRRARTPWVYRGMSDEAL